MEFKMPKEIGNYEAKFIGPFSLRQSVALAFVGGCSIFVYNTLRPTIGDNLTGFLIMIPAAIAWLVGWYKPYGMHFEKFIGSIYISTFLSPSKRKFVSENSWDVLMRTSVLEDVEETNDKKKVVKKKYKKSKKAIR